MKTLLIVTSLLLACQAVRAGDPNTDSAAGKRARKAGPVVDVKPPSARADAPMYVIEKRSVFNASAGDHNPFWPIGWVKMESLPDTAAPVVPHAEDFTVTSILLNEPPIAVINGKEMAEGEIATLPIDGQPVMVQLMAVQDGRVILRWQNQNIVVLLHREEDLSPTDGNAPVALR